MPSIGAILLLAVALGVGVSPALAGDKPALGWVEKVRLYPGGLILQAKLDSGAEFCSLNASNLTEFTRQGQKWVKFQVANHLGQTKTFECQVRRLAKIKRRGGGFHRRPVVKLGLCLGNLFEEVEVNLADRTGFIYPLLIGRNFMRGKLVIDPATMFTVEPQCPQGEHE
ncbi:MAG: RimK/LysX family protein [Syntrophales bacterium]|nr:RimK/LysX family protein [Syntrophales bacterium]MDD5640058.1 RimK/LysX family protein [Syntrophales bacterium]